MDCKIRFHNFIDDFAALEFRLTDFKPQFYAVFVFFFPKFQKSRPLGLYHSIVYYGDKKGIIQNDETFSEVQKYQNKENN